MIAKREMIAFLSIDGMNSKSKRQPRTRTKLRGGGQFSQAAAALYQFLGMLQTPRIMAAEASSDRKSHLKKNLEIRDYCRGDEYERAGKGLDFCVQN